MDNFITVLGESTGEITEKRSKFIATVRHCDTEDDANAFIAEMRSKYWDAKHNVFAYCVNDGAAIRFSDDNEPHSTAGKPVLDVITGNALKNVAIVVTRYFGGILLGTGGLVHAYSSSASLAVQNAKIAQMIPCVTYKTVCDYSEHSKMINLIENHNGNIDSTDFADKITLTYTFKKEETQTFITNLNEIFSAKLTAEFIEEKISPFL